MRTSKKARPGLVSSSIATRVAPVGMALAAVVVGAISLLAGGCGDSGQDTLCTPGTEVFCRCRGGQLSGTQTCAEDGMSLGECTTPEGTCPTVDPSTTTTGSASGICTPGEEIICACEDGTQGSKLCSDDGQSFGDCTTPTGPCGSGMTGTKLLYETCADGTECATGVCSSGYCTRSCETYVDCVDEPNMRFGDCIVLGGEQLCAPYCTNQGDCASFGPNNVCGGAVALDDPQLSFAACADWGADAIGIPEGTPCDTNTGEVLYLGQNVIMMDCDLGLAVETVCSFDVCTKGCYENSDCPNADCSSNGSVIGCCTSSPTCN